MAATLLLQALVHAQPVASKAAAYHVSEFEVTDPKPTRPCSGTVESTFTPFGGRYVVRGGQVTSLEADPTRRIVMSRRSCLSPAVTPA